VLIADDHAKMHSAVSRLLSPSCDVVGSAVDIATLFDGVVQLRPDVVLLDLSLRGEVSSLEACRRILTLAPAVRVLMLTAHDDEDIRRAAYEAGCSGFVWKPNMEKELTGAIQAVFDGNS
jgi:DNA-binding NarL/FixJ family response regulator